MSAKETPELLKLVDVHCRQHTRLLRVYYTYTMDLDDFHQVFPDQKKNPYTKDRVSAIVRNRSLLDGSLFIDRLLTVVADIEDRTPSSSIPRDYLFILIFYSFTHLPR